MNQRVLTFWVTPPEEGGFGPQPVGRLTLSSSHLRFRLDYGEDVGQVPRAFSDPTLLKAAGTPLAPGDQNLGRGFDQGEAMYGEVEDYGYCFFIAKIFMRLKNLFTLKSGIAVVNDAFGKLRAGKNIFTEDGTWLVGNDVRVNNDSSISGVATHGFRRGRDVVVRGGVVPGPSLPVLDPFPPVPSVMCGGTDIDVAGESTVVLMPGSYGAITVENGGVLVLTPGTYDVCAFTAGRATTTEFLPEAPSILNVAGRLKIGAESSFGVADTGVPPLVNVAGSRVTFAQGTVIEADTNAPDAKLILGRGATYSGSFLARTVSSDHSVTCGCMR